MTTLRLGAGVLSMVIASANVYAADYLVTSSADSGPNTLRAALTDIATRPDSESHFVGLQLPPGSQISLESELPAIRGTAITIEAMTASTTIVRAGPFLVFRLSGQPSPQQSVTLKNVRILGGAASGPGCILAPQPLIGTGALLQLVNVEVSDCISDSGVPAVSASTIVVERGVFANNRARTASTSSVVQGGALRGGTIFVRNSRFQGNQVSTPNAGGISGGSSISAGTSLVVEDSDFSQDLPSIGPIEPGGVIRCATSCTVRRSSFRDNAAPVIAKQNSASLLIENSSFVNSINRPAVRLTNLFPSVSRLTIRNSTFVGAPATTSVVAHLEIEPATTSTIISISNTVFGPLGGAQAGCSVTGEFSADGAGFNIASDLSCARLSPIGSATISDDIRLQAPLPPVIPAVVWSLPLGTGSPAIDAGSPSMPGGVPPACVADDALRRVRPADGDSDGTPRCDIGAAEVPDALTLDVLLRDGFD